jgi:hypothetical protein
MAKNSSKKKKKRGDQQALPPGCLPSKGSSFNEIMERDFEELVIRLDKKTNEYVFRTACCKGTRVC